jgi:sugar phosphate isomerase/epimerase
MRTLMPNRTDRRQFLKAAGAAALAGAEISRAEAIRGGQTRPAGEASATARLLVGCCAYSYAKYLADGRMTMEDFIRKGVELRVDGVDITTYWLKSTDPAYLVSLRHLAFQNAMPFSGAAISTNMCQPHPDERARQLKEIRKWVDATEWLGASHLRVFGGELPKGATVQQGVEWVVETMKPACDYAARKGITLGIEDHHGITARAEPVLEILKRVDSPYAGINLDISNFSANSAEDEYAQIEACVPFATHTHIRDRFTDSHAPIDLDRVWRIFARAGYKGYMSAEYEGEEDAMTAVPKLLEKIRALSEKYSTV